MLPETGYDQARIDFRKVTVAIKIIPDDFIQAQLNLVIDVRPSENGVEQLLKNNVDLRTVGIRECFHRNFLSDAL